MSRLLDAVQAALHCADPDAKYAQVQHLAALISPEALADCGSAARTPLTGPPGRPPRPPLVHPRDVAQRGLGTLAGRCALLHAVAHIEFNAINLALDAVHRFAQLPADYYADWLGVAADEARHFVLVRERLRGLGMDYGELAAHNGLWEACEKTAHDVMLRMALVPRVLEARGLDVTPGMIDRLRDVGDHDSIALLQLILREEVAHVAAGTRWFRHLARQRGLDADAEFPRLLAEHRVQLRPPFNVEARLRAGFVAAEAPTELQQALNAGQRSTASL